MRMSFLALGLFLAGCMPMVSSAEQYATEEDVVALQDDLRNLEAHLDAMKDRGVSLPSEHSDRVQQIRDNAIYIRVVMKRHQQSGKEGTGVAIDEVRSLRNEIAALVSDLDRLGSGNSPGSVTLPVGTEVDVRLQDSLSTAASQPGDEFTATAVQPVTRGGRIVVPAGAVFHGVIEVADRPEGPTDRNARLVLAFDRVSIHGVTHGISASVTGASEKLETGIGDEKTKMGVGAGIGSILGAVMGGKKGAVVGAIVGGAGAILATEGKDVELPRGTVLTIRLDRELEVRLPKPPG